MLYFFCQELHFGCFNGKKPATWLWSECFAILTICLLSGNATAFTSFKQGVVSTIALIMELLQFHAFTLFVKEASNFAVAFLRFILIWKNVFVKNIVLEVSWFMICSFWLEYFQAFLLSINLSSQIRSLV